jgi:hypothetical protein
MKPNLRNQDNEKEMNKNKISPISAVFLMCLFGGSSSFFFNLVRGQNDIYSWVIRVTGILFALICFYIPVNLLPECKIKKVLIIIFGLPISISYFVIRYWTIFLGIILSVLLIFAFQVSIFTLLNKVIVTKMQVWYFVAIFTSLVVVSYLNPIVRVIVRLIYLPKSEKKEKLFQETLIALKKINFRKIAYMIGFLLYFISVLDKFSGTVMINIDLWIGIKDVAQESFITFLALDACVSIVAPKVIERKEK